MMDEGLYVDTLERFLRHSNEDTVDVEGIFRQLDTRALRGKTAIRLLDVGSGDGEKALCFARVLRKQGIATVIDSVEPKLGQRELLREAHAREQGTFLGRVFDCPLHQAQLEGPYDVILVIHSLYEFPRQDDDTISGLEQLPALLSSDGIGIVIVEHTQGDFQRLKRTFYPSFGKRSPVSEELIQATLRRHRVPHTLGRLIDINFPLGNLEDLSPVQLGESLSFLFSDSLQSPALTQQEYAAVGNWIRNNCRRNADNGLYLWRPDALIWIHASGLIDKR